MASNDDDTLHTQDDLATTFLKDEVSTATLEKWRVTGKGPRFIRAGRKIFYRRSDIEAWLKDNTVRFTHESSRSPSTPAKRPRHVDTNDAA